MYVLCLVAQLCPTLCDPMDCSLPGYNLFMGILQARILEWVAMLSFRGSFQSRDQIQIYHWHCMHMLYYLCHHIKVLICIFLLPMILRSIKDANRHFVFILDELKIQVFFFFFFSLLHHLITYYWCLGVLIIIWIWALTFLFSLIMPSVTKILSFNEDNFINVSFYS